MNSKYQNPPPNPDPHIVCVPHVNEPSIVGHKENKYFWLNILRKAIEGYSFFLLYYIWENNFQTNTFVFDRTTNLRFNKMQNEIYGSLVTIQYHAKCSNPFFRKFTRTKICFCIFFAANLTWSIAYFLIPITEKFSHSVISHCNL